jgi:hypothetical protein
MDDTGIGGVRCSITIDGMAADEIAALSGVTITLKMPSGVVRNIPAPVSGINKTALPDGIIVSLVVEVTERGMHTMGARLHYTGGTSITTRTAIRFRATDDMA